MFQRLGCVLFVATLFFARAVSNHEIETSGHNGNDVTWRYFTRFLDAGRGSEVSGMSELKKYFNRFGYLNSSATDFSDIFDDQFESAVTLYQKKLGLRETGNIDSDTLSTIMSPRCGMSDTVHPVHVNRHYAYFSGEPRWVHASTLTYAFSSYNTIDYLTISEIKSVFSRSFDRWSAVIPMNFTESKDYQSADIRIGFYPGDHGDGQPFDGVLGILAHAFSPENGRLHLDSSERWAVDFKVEKSEVAVDLESVATHEIGHILGLAHSSVKEAVMYPNLRPRTRRMDLKIDDVTGVQALYGSNPNFKMNSFLTSQNSNDNGFGWAGKLSRWNTFFAFVIFFSSLCL